jgi:hypothetical protein
VAPFQQNVYAFRQFAHEKVFGILLMAEKQRGFRDQAPIV